MIDWARLRRVVDPRRATTRERRRIWEAVDGRIDDAPRRRRRAWTMASVGVAFAASALVYATRPQRPAREARPSAAAESLAPRFVTTAAGPRPERERDVWTVRAAAGCASEEGGDSVPAVDAFIDSMGLNIRAGYYPESFPMLGERLEALGVRHVADMAATRLDLLAGLGERGVRSQLWITPDTDVVALAKRGGGFIEALAFHNGLGPKPAAAWADEMRGFIARVAAELRADPALSPIGLVGPTVAAADKRAALGNIAELVDFGASGSPSWAAPPGGEALADLVAQHREIVGPHEQLVVGQALYSTGPGAAAVSEAVQAKYLLRTYAENWRAGIVRTYGPHIVDWTAMPTTYDHGLGILRFDGTPKVAYLALQAFIRTLRGVSAAPSGPLGVRIENEGPPVRHVLVRRRGGAFALLLWLGLRSTDAPISTRATLTFEAAPTRLLVHRPQRGLPPADLSGTVRGRTVTVDVADDVLVLEVTTACPAGRAGAIEK